MKVFKVRFLPVILATFWISISEFFRNEFLLKQFWNGHYVKMGLQFPSEPINGAVWGIWSLLFAIFIAILLKRFNFWQTSLITWIVGFVFMWLVIGNLGVLPYGILPVAVPLSMVEVLIAALILSRFSKN